MFKLTKYECILAVVFLLTLPLSNPWVRGDGVGYYAFARALLIEHNLNFVKDWQEANPSFRMGRVDAEGYLLPQQYTRTGHVDNHFSIGPAILWSPFLIVAHLGVLSYDALGGLVPADGYSRAYTYAMAFGTALYGFLSLWISFLLARKYLPERWAFLATIGIWFASSLPVYMYFNPSWSHAHSAFMVALFVWYWDRTRGTRTWAQWAGLGAVAGLMLDQYYINGVVLLIPLIESLEHYWRARRAPFSRPVGELFIGNILFSAVMIIFFLPTLVTKKIIYGNYLQTGYEHLWDWKSPYLLKVMFSSEHGLFSWTPVLLFAVVGFFFLRRADKALARYSAITFTAFLYVVGSYVDWHGLSSFGSRFFVSLTVLFVLGLAALVDKAARVWGERRTEWMAVAVTTALIAWNFGLIFQWGTHLIPARGPISYRAAAYNQVMVVPERAAATLKSYLTRRRQMMGDIEKEDMQQIKSARPEGTE